MQASIATPSRSVRRQSIAGEQLDELYGLVVLARDRKAAVMRPQICDRSSLVVPGEVSQRDVERARPDRPRLPEIDRYRPPGTAGSAGSHLG